MLGCGGIMKGFLRLALGCLAADLLALPGRAQERAGQPLGSLVALPGGNHSGLGDASAPPPSPDFCRGYFDVMGQWDPPFNCSSGEFVFCCGTCGFRFCCKFKKTRLDQDTCTNYETPVWMNTGKPPARADDPLHDPTRDKTNLIVYIICGVVAVMVLVGIFTKLGLEKAHRPQREHMSRALADVMRPQGPCTTDHMERDLNIVVHVQHYENMETRPPANNLRDLTECLKKVLGIKLPTAYLTRRDFLSAHDNTLQGWDIRNVEFEDLMLLSIFTEFIGRLLTCPRAFRNKLHSKDSQDPSSRICEASLISSSLMQLNRQQQELGAFLQEVCHSE